MKHPRWPHSLPQAWLAWPGLGAILVLGGCGSTSAPRTGDLEKDLRHEDPRVRALATKDAVESERKDLLPLLVENLADHDAAVRMFSAIALRKLTGTDLGYDPSDPPFRREEAIVAWREWLAERAREEEAGESQSGSARPGSPGGGPE